MKVPRLLTYGRKPNAHEMKMRSEAEINRNFEGGEEFHC